MNARKDKIADSEYGGTESIYGTDNVNEAKDTGGTKRYDRKKEMKKNQEDMSQKIQEEMKKNQEKMKKNQEDMDQKFQE